METLTTDERHPPDGLLMKTLRERDWETALTVILHSPHYTKKLNTGRGLPLHFAFYTGAPFAVVTALVEANPDATTIQTYSHNLPCHASCSYGISSEGMKMLLRCNPDAAAVMNDRHETPMKCLHMCVWDVFAGEKEQVTNDLKQEPSYWKTKEQQALLQKAFEETDRRRSMRRAVAKIVLSRQLDIYDLIAPNIEYL